MKKTILLFSKKGAPEAKAAMDRLTEWLKKRGYEVFDATNLEGKIANAQLKTVSLAVVIGGDGTFLTLVRSLEKKDHFPIMGINLGSLGFITEINREEMLTAIEEVLAGKYVEESRPLLDVDICKEDVCNHSGIVFNDAVISKDAPTSMLKMDVTVDGEYLSHVRADGYIISTATGSTGYGLSAGGPLIHPRVNGTLLVPICSHALDSRPIVIPQDTIVEVFLKEVTGRVYLVYDGQINVEIHRGDTVKIRPSKSSLRLIRSPQQKWSQIIRAKFQMS